MSVSSRPQRTRGRRRLGRGRRLCRARLCAASQHDVRHAFDRRRSCIHIAARHSPAHLSAATRKQCVRERLDAQPLSARVAAARARRSVRALLTDRRAFARWCGGGGGGFGVESAVGRQRGRRRHAGLSLRAPARSRFFRRERQARGRARKAGQRRRQAGRPFRSLAFRRIQPRAVCRCAGTARLLRVIGGGRRRRKWRQRAGRSGSWISRHRRRADRIAFAIDGAFRW